MTTDFDSRIIPLNVGGTKYEVSYGTLAHCGESMLDVLNECTGGYKQKPIFIDRNGRLFEYVLDYLRNDKVYLPFTVSRDSIKDELEYFEINVDMSKVYQTCGTEYFDLFIEKAEAVQIKEHAIQTAILVEEEYRSKPPLANRILIPQSNYTQISGHEDGLREEFRKKGLTFLSLEWNGGSPIIKVSK